MRKIIILSAIAATVLGGATLAEARDSRVSCTSAPASQWLSTAELSAKFAAQGYTVHKIELKRGCGEANLVDRNGVRTEVRFDPTTGAVTARHAEVSHQSRAHRDDRDHRNHRDGRQHRQHRDGRR
jgi:hypothetical protein